MLSLTQPGSSCTSYTSVAVAVSHRQQQSSIWLAFPLGRSRAPTELYTVPFALRNQLALTCAHASRGPATGLCSPARSSCMPARFACSAAGLFSFRFFVVGLQKSNLQFFYALQKIIKKFIHLGKNYHRFWKNFINFLKSSQN